MSFKKIGEETFILNIYLMHNLSSVYLLIRFPFFHLFDLELDMCIFKNAKCVKRRKMVIVKYRVQNGI